MLIRTLLLYPAKTILSPLFLVLVVVIAASISLGRIRPARRQAGLILIAASILWILSTRLAWQPLYRSLLVPPAAGTAQPQVIVIASAGWRQGTTRELDSLNATSSARLLAGVRWWQQHPDARLVMAGVAETSNGTSSRPIELMREDAIRMGVPPAAITLEGHSRNTREHAIELRKLPGMSAATKVGIVSSPQHMRRMLFSFRRSFNSVYVCPIDVESPDPPWLLNDLIPDSNDLEISTLLLQEWIGIAWYALRG